MAARERVGLQVRGCSMPERGGWGACGVSSSICRNQLIRFRRLCRRLSKQTEGPRDFRPGRHGPILSSLSACLNRSASSPLTAISRSAGGRLPGKPAASVASLACPSACRRPPLRPRARCRALRLRNCAWIMTAFSSPPAQAGHAIIPAKTAVPAGARLTGALHLRDTTASTGWMAPWKGHVPAARRPSDPLRRKRLQPP